MPRIIVALAAVALAGCGSQPAADRDSNEAAATPSVAVSPVAAARPLPDLSTCPPRNPIDEGLRQRTEPIAVPAALGAVMRSDIDDFAVSTLDGSTVCVEASWMESIANAALSADKRFVSFGWDGYEAFGHMIVDRAGKGLAIDTGTPPVTSPSGILLAAADLSESGFGALNAFAVWQIEPAGMRQVTKQEDVPPATDWRIERWAGDACVELSAVAWDDATGAGGDPRKRYNASRSNGWRVAPGPCPTS